MENERKGEEFLQVATDKEDDVASFSVVLTSKLNKMFQIIQCINPNWVTRHPRVATSSFIGDSWVSDTVIGGPPGSCWVPAHVLLLVAGSSGVGGLVGRPVLSLTIPFSPAEVFPPPSFLAQEVSISFPVVFSILACDNVGIWIGPQQKVQESPVMGVKELDRFTQSPKEFTVYTKRKQCGKETVVAEIGVDPPLSKGLDRQLSSSILAKLKLFR
ncbi:hypothetical protein Cgig2_013536 [Carnegiea gigantea]|uniref:Uncharacterized protein n=1 Tax=Carnegiea gigantea TaxID=171969 RepID=A0A9Q1JUU6_9CARY|nr:hypothetical protein Cgig2_013536 [Carnegiea gigantea]